jgi:hypothetical protein
MYTLVGRFTVDPKTGDYVGIIAKHEGKTITVLTLGAEDSETAILMWLRGTIAAMREQGRTDVQLPDKYDRKKERAAVQHAMQH